MSYWLGNSRDEYQVACVWDGHKPPWYPPAPVTSQRWVELGPHAPTFEAARSLANDLRAKDGYARIALKQWVEEDGIKLQEVYRTPTGAPLCRRMDVE